MREFWVTGFKVKLGLWNLVGTKSIVSQYKLHMQVWEEEPYWFWVKGQGQLKLSAVKHCWYNTADYRFGPFTSKLSFIDERRSPIDSGSKVKVNIPTMLVGYRLLLYHLKVGQSLLMLGRRSRGQIARACFAELTFGNPQHARALYFFFWCVHLIVLHSPKLPRFLDSNFTTPHIAMECIFSSQQPPWPLEKTTTYPRWYRLV